MMDLTLQSQLESIVAEAEKKESALEKGLPDAQVIEKGASLAEE